MTNEPTVSKRAQKNVVLNAIHPAPYIDNWIKTIRERYELVAVYNYATSAAKTWSDYRGEAGTLASDISFIKLVRTYADADLVIFSGWFERRNLLAIIILKLTRNKVAVFSDYPVNARKSRLNILLKKILIRLYIDAIFCATQSTVEWYAETLGVPRRKLRFFPYAMSVLADENIVSKIPLTSRGKGTPEIFRVFIANNFRPIKGYATLLNSLRRLKEEGVLENFSFVIAGTGEELDAYEKEFMTLGGNIEMLGWVELSEYENQLRAANIFVHASNFEPFGIPPLDAISAGTPIVVSTGVQSVSGLIENGRSGYVFKQGSGEALAESLKLAFAEREQLPEMARLAHAVLKREFNSEQWLAGIDWVFAKSSLSTNA
jgi:glycosyltransferase involved in cell wall biosynthesis